MVPQDRFRPTLRELVVAVTAITLTQSPIPVSAADSLTPSPIRPAAVELHLRLVEPDIYLDRGGRLAVATEDCQGPAAFETDVHLPPRAEPYETDLSFPSCIRA